MCRNPQTGDKKKERGVSPLLKLESLPSMADSFARRNYEAAGSVPREIVLTTSSLRWFRNCLELVGLDVLVERPHPFSA